MKIWRNPGLWIMLVSVLIIGIYPNIIQNTYLRERLFTILMSVALASSLNIILGYAGYVSFGHVIFFGLGGYVGLFLMSRGFSLWLSMLGGGLTSGTIALILGRAILRLRGAYFALATIGVNEAMRAFVNNFTPFGGPTGISLNFALYQQYGGAAKMQWLVYYLLLTLALILIAASFLIKQSKFGLSLMAIREDEDAAEIMGVFTPNAKTWAYVISAIAPGILGVLFYFKNGNIEPAEAFRLHSSIELLVMVMLGGFGTVIGPVIGALGYQVLRGFLLTNELFKDFQLVVSGIMLLLIILFIPAGAVGWLRNRFPVLRRFMP